MHVECTCKLCPKKKQVYRPPFPPFICCFDTLAHVGMGARRGCSSCEVSGRTCKRLRTKKRIITDLGFLRLLFLLLRLRFGDGLQSRLMPDVGGLIPPGSDGGEVCADDTPLVFDGA